nr:outer membrane beta-barrel protein [uncultured Porphyromonas sp.]
MYKLPLYALLVALAMGIPATAQHSPLRIGAEVGGTSANLRVSSGKSTGGLQPSYGLRLGIGAELSLGLLGYVATGIYYQSQGAQNDLTLANAQPIGYPSNARMGKEQLDLRYVNIPVAYGLHLAIPGVGVALSGEAGLSYSIGMTSRYQYLVEGAKGQGMEYRVFEDEESKAGNSTPSGERLQFRKKDLALHLAAKLELQKIFLRIGVEQGLRSVTKHAPYGMKNTTGWFTLGIRLL